MATQRWRGDAQPIAQVYTFTVTAFDVTTTYKVTINGKVVSCLGSTTNNLTASALQAALIASAIPEFKEITWTVLAAVVTGTAATPGKSFTAAGSVSGGAGTQSDANPTASSGPWDYGLAANWTSAVPVATDTVWIEQGTGVFYTLDQHAVTLTELDIPMTFTGTIGLPYVDANGYIEYRGQYLQAPATTTNIGKGPGSGSGRIRLDQSSVQTALSVYNTGSSVDSGLEALQWKGTNASNTVEIVKGSVGIAVFPGEVATVATLRVGYVANVLSDVSCRCGVGVTLTTIEQSGGTLQTNSALTTMNMTNGVWSHMLGAVTTINLLGGTCYYRSAGTITTLVLGSNAIMDFSQDLSPRTITNKVLMYAGSQLLDPHGTVTFTAGIQFVACGIEDVTLKLGESRTIGSIV